MVARLLLLLLRVVCVPLCVHALHPRCHSM